MALYEVDYSYHLPEWSTIELDLDEDLDAKERELEALTEIKSRFPDITNIDIEQMRII